MLTTTESQALRYFVLDADGQLRKARPKRVEATLDGRMSSADLGCPGVRSLFLATVVCDAALLPRAVYLLRVPLTHGRFTASDELTLRTLASPSCVTPHEAATHHGAGWPQDLVRQFAVALDVPVSGMAVPFAAGGPVLDAVVRRGSMRQSQS
jgi:hypothetical protein